MVSEKIVTEKKKKKICIAQLNKRHQSDTASEIGIFTQCVCVCVCEDGVAMETQSSIPACEKKYIQLFSILYDLLGEKKNWKENTVRD